MKFSLATIALTVASVSARGLQGSAPTYHEEPLGRGILEDLETYYNGFCSLCDIGDIFNQDIMFCDLCSDDDGDDGDSGGIFGGLGDLFGSITCFSEVSTVQVENVGTVNMKNLKVGARVLTESGDFEPVIAFAHRAPTVAAEFLQFKTVAGDLEMTADHLVFVAGKSSPVRADSIQVGDALRGEGATVDSIKNVQRTGLYAPMTPSGTVVVDGIAASSYISIDKNSEFLTIGGQAIMSYHNYIHLTLSPFRMLAMGVSSTLANMYTEGGFPVYVEYGLKFLTWANSQNVFVQFLAFLVAVVVTGTSMVLENTFGASMAPLAIVAGAGAATYLANNIVVRANKVKTV